MHRDDSTRRTRKPILAKILTQEMKDIIIPGNSVDACRLIIREAAAVLQGRSERMLTQAAPDDWKSKTAAMLSMDHVKKLSWVHGLLEEKPETELKKVTE